eukprot:3459658-Pleurochrysis_carterae.AAC.1
MGRCFRARICQIIPSPAFAIALISVGTDTSYAAMPNAKGSSALLQQPKSSKSSVLECHARKHIALSSKRKQQHAAATMLISYL